MKNIRNLLIKALCSLILFAVVFSLVSCDGEVSDKANGDTVAGETATDEVTEETTNEVTEETTDDATEETTDEATEETEVLKELLYINSKYYVCAKAATAFINKDTDTLEELLGCRKGVLEKYSDFEFGVYRFKITESALEMTVKITKSSLDDVPVGEYTVTFSGGRFGVVNMAGLGTYSSNAEFEDFQSMPAQYVRRWIVFVGEWDFACIYDINESEEMNGRKECMIMYLNIYDDNMDTVEDYQKAAFDIFGLENLDIPETLLEEDGTVIDSWGHGGAVRTYRKLSEETDPETKITTIRVQTYADFAGTVPSHIYEYKLEDCGDYCKVISSYLFAEGEYEPEDRYVA